MDCRLFLGAYGTTALSGFEFFKRKFRAAARSSTVFGGRPAGSRSSGLLRVFWDRLCAPSKGVSGNQLV